MIKRIKHPQLVSFLAALYIELLLVAKILLAALPSLGSLMIPLHIGVVVLFAIVTVSESFRNIETSIISWCIFIACVLAYYLTLHYSHFKSDLEFIYFAPHVLFPIVMAQQRIDARSFLFSAMAIPFAGILFLGKIFVFTELEDSISMSTSYAFLLPVMATIVFCFYYYKSSSPWIKRLTIVFALINTVYLFEIFLYGARGAVLSLFVLFVMLFLFPLIKDRGLSRINFRTFIAILLLSVIVFNLTTTLVVLDSFLNSLGFRVYAIDRSIEYLEAGDLTTGRAELTKATIDYIREKPIFGHGLQTFSDGFYGQLGYPHNSILQLLFDGGLVLAVLILFPVVYKLFRWWKTCDHNEYCIVLTLFCASVPGSLFSMDVWTQPIFWFFIGYITKYTTGRTINRLIN